MLALVSIIIPCYNQGKFIEETVKSVLLQTYINFEIIIVNDGSTDPYTIDLLKNKTWENTRIININNAGVANARNVGIANSKGKYILPLDGDDLIANTYLEKAVQILEANEDIKVVTSEVRYFGKMNSLFNLPEFSITGLMGQNLLVCTSMYRRTDFDATNGYNTNMNDGFEDWDFWLSLIKPGEKIYKIKEVLFFYRINRRSRNSSISVELQAKLRMQIYNNHIDLFSSNFLNPLECFEYLNVINSKEYKIGKIILQPIRKLIRLLSL
jgi:glycosyltransferase involved in cell wall biosynthesis